MSKKLSRYLEDIEKTEKKMAELKAHLEAVRQSQKADEDAEIVRSIRSMNVKGWDLLRLLDSIQNGTVELRPVDQFINKYPHQLTTLCMALTLFPVTAFAYAEPEPTPTPEPVIEETTPGGTPFSVPGNGEILDDITDDPTKDFLTVTTANGNTFFLVIDRSQNTENVYMLSMIDELDLQDFIEESEQEEPAQAGVVLEEPAQTTEPTQAVEPETEEEPASNGLPLFLIVIMLTAVAGVGAYFYFKIYKPQHEQDNSESENMEISDGLETINEDEPADTDEDAGSDETQ